MEYVTLTRKDPEFKDYLLGTFDHSLRALPVETFSGAGGERVTFCVRPVNEIEIPKWWRVYFAACRPELLVLTLGPAVLVSALHPGADWPWAQFLGLFFLHVAAFLFNDYQDHVRGVDRLNRKRGSRVIQKGWVTALALKRWAIVNFTLAVLFGLPPLLAGPADLWIVVGIAALALFVLSRKSGLRFGLCDFAIFLLFGPLLTAGVALSAYGEVTPSDLGLGALIGSLTVWVFQVRQFEHLFRSRPDMFHTCLGYWSFETARAFVVFEAGLLTLLQAGFGAALGVSGFGLALLPIAAVPLLNCAFRIRRAGSPLASEFIGISRVALLAHFSWTIWWTQGLVSLWVFA